MKKSEWSIQSKKHLVLLLHALFLVLVMTGASFIYLNSNFGRGLSWIHEESFADTSSFKTLLEDDIDKIFQYVNYKDVFETDGLIDYSKEMVSVTSNSGKTIIYTLNDLTRYAKNQGYYLSDTFEVAGGPGPISPLEPSAETAEPLVNWKVYKPNEQYHEPGDAFASLEDLSLEVLTLLGEYYRIQYNYIEKPSNLYFRVFYRDDNHHDYVYTNAGTKTPEDIRALGRYLYISGDSILMDTNMRHVPDNITALLETYNIYDNGNYYIAIGLDTDYPNQDIYSKSNYEYNQIRVDYIFGLVLLGIGLLGCLITLLYLSALSGYETNERKSVRLHGFDQIPLECSFLLFAGLLAFGFLIVQEIGNPLLHLVVNNHYWSYAERLLWAFVVYLISFNQSFLWLRCYKAHTLWSNSLLHHAYLWLLRYLTGCSFPFRLTLSFIGFWTVNLTLLAVFFYFFLNQSLLSATYVYLVPAVAFLGFNLWVFFLLWRNASENQKISQALYSMTDGDTSYKIDLMGFSGKELELAKTINNISVGLSTALQEQVKSERLKADLITNVSHDIKTPLTSIINYVDLIKREHIQDEKVQRYLEVLDQKSQRLKTLTEDLVEASKASSGNLKLEIARIDIVELIQQTNGEFEEKFALRHLEMVSHLPNQVIFIEADGRRLWRVLENLYNNAFKYAMEQSRVYIDITANDGWVSITIKNISENPLNINAGELTERFVRGDVARTTEGSGLGLSIAKSLTELQGGRFELYIDGDLFKAQISFPTLVIPTDY
ncbi:MAG: HAMP domain-containing sensor histidine kinase [Hungatella sp.]